MRLAFCLSEGLRISAGGSAPLLAWQSRLRLWQAIPCYTEVGTLKAPIRDDRRGYGVNAEGTSNSSHHRGVYPGFYCELTPPFPGKVKGQQPSSEQANQSRGVPLCCQVRDVHGTRPFQK